MAAEQITPNLDDASAAGIKLLLLDSNSTAAIVGAISEIKYSLSDVDGVIVNSRENIALTPANPVIVPLTVEDTTVSGIASTVDRLLTVTWTYTDAVLGADTVKSKEYILTIDNFKGKS